MQASAHDRTDQPLQHTTTIPPSYLWREEAIIRFKKGAVPVLVSTIGVGGRGLKFQGVDCLIFWEMPESLEQYKWCLGRVGRLGNPAKAFVLATKDKNLKDDHKFANFLQVNGAEFDLDVEGNKTEKKVEGDSSDEGKVEGDSSDVKGKGKIEGDSSDVKGKAKVEGDSSDVKGKAKVEGDNWDDGSWNKPTTGMRW
ncbi:hypothetical protein JMJ35_001712 [Cladonia borealis]|uniref:Helicase C-terminal domain-containing protein n=1 Tax=Cladonia borealis TaxID=184061 RepID=A0AA39R9A3_9LECA|nr:hypothetical protein JMJ35_001712 [Cladonia borealis]